MTSQSMNTPSPWELLVTAAARGESLTLTSEQVHLLGCHRVVESRASSARIDREKVALMEQAGPDDFVVLSLNHTQRRHRAVTLWQADDKGYCWRLSGAGIYQREQVMQFLGYYNDGCSNLAVPLATARALARVVGYDTREQGVCLANDRPTWQALIASAIATPAATPCPEYRGAKRRRQA